MIDVVANSLEQQLWQRINLDADDPGLILSYGLFLPNAPKKALLNQALRLVLCQNMPNLLSRFFEVDGVLRKVLTIPSLTVLHDCDSESELGRRPQELIDHIAGPLFCFRLLPGKEEGHILALHFSHLVFDGSSYRDFCDALSINLKRELVDQSASGTALNTVSINLPIVRQENIDFWAAYLSERSLGNSLPFLKAGNEIGFSSQKLSITGAKLSQLLAATRAGNVTVFEYLLACIATLVGKYSTSYEVTKELCITYLVSLRDHNTPIGCNANPVPIFLKVDEESTVSQYLDHVRESRRQSRQHQHVPLLTILNQADEKSNRNSNILNLLVNMSPGLLPLCVPEFPQTGCRYVMRPETGGPFDLALNYNYNDNELVLSFDAPNSRASVAFLAEFSVNFVNVIDFFAMNDSLPLSQLSLSKALYPVARGQQQDKDKGRCVVDSILSGCRQRKDDIAIICDDREVNYKLLLSHVERLSNDICVACPTENRPVIGIHLQRSEWLPVAILSALNLRATFVPLETTLPPDRLDYIVNVSNINVIIVDDALMVDQLSSRYAQINFIAIDGVSTPDKDNLDSYRPLSPSGSPDNRTAYVMFTSGSTGLPKGVEISGSNLANFLTSMARHPGMSASERLLAVTPISFDIAILELLLPLFCGASVEIIDDATRQNAMALAKKINQSKSNMIQATPATWLMLKNRQWRPQRRLKILAGGEALDPDLADYLLNQNHTLYNMYGPTEATVWASCSMIKDKDTIELGEPVNNTEFYVVDDTFRSTPIGVPGQLLIRGECVGLGYLNADSAKSFIHLENAPDSFYCTGDLVRHTGHGRIEYIGRIDNQIKINGYRVEPEEISCRLKQIIPGAEVVTVLRTLPTEHLCSFYIVEQTDPPMTSRQQRAIVNHEQVITQLSASLPAYMVPKAIVQLSDFPVTQNGKIAIKPLCQIPLSELALVDDNNTEGGSREAITPIAEQDCLLITLEKLFHKLFDIQIDDPGFPLGWYGLNSISYNQLSYQLEAVFNVAIAPYEFYSINTLALLRDHIISVSKKDPALIVARTDTEIEKAENPEKHHTLHNKTTHSHQADSVDIAIIGLSVKMPKGLEEDDFWQCLIEKTDLICQSDRHYLSPGSYAGFVDGVDNFDARFFSISPLEAHHMDPRQRLLLQTAWKTVEDAGYQRSGLAGEKISCYIAATGIDYAILQARENFSLSPYTLSGSSLSILSNRLSNFFDWRGPSCTLDTACSGSLSALVKACNDLRQGVSDAALVGGVNLILDPHISDGLQAGNFLSVNHRCATFDVKADGYVRGEGLGCVFIKRLDDAINDGDNIRGVIKSATENHGGRANSLTAPNPKAQEALLLDAYTEDLAKQVSYIETHGTGTQLGDPIEFAALQAAWEKLHANDIDQPVWLGALKSNTGHLEAAAGIASLAKVLLAFKHRIIPANIHFSTTNPQIDLETTRFRIVEENQPWVAADHPRLAGISSFGFGGSNAHVVVQEPPTVVKERSTVSQSPHLVTLSARSIKSLEAMRRQLLAFLQKPLDQEISLAQMAYTLNTGREHFEYRQAWVVHSLGELANALETALEAVEKINTGTSTLFSSAFPSNPDDRESQLYQWRSAYLRGANLDWPVLYPKGTVQRVHLPQYCFDEKPFWFDRTRRPSPIRGGHQPLMKRKA